MEMEKLEGRKGVSERISRAGELHDLDEKEASLIFSTSCFVIPNRPDCVLHMSSAQDLHAKNDICNAHAWRTSEVPHSWQMREKCLVGNFIRPHLAFFLSSVLSGPIF